MPNSDAAKAAATLVDLNDIAAFLHKDAQEHMMPGSAPDRALQLAAIENAKRFVGGATPETGSAYEKLKERFAVLDHLEGITGIMDKDRQTFMPKEELPNRSRQIQTLAVLSFELITDPAVRTWLDEAEKNAVALPKEDQRNLFLMRKAWTESNGYTAELAQELARIGTEGEELHTEHRPKGDWENMRDWYAHSFDTLRTKGEAKMAALPGQFATPYEALLDSFGPGTKDATIAREFAKLEKALPALIHEAKALQDTEPKAVDIKGPFTSAQIEDLCQLLLKAEGYHINRGRLDICPAHPTSVGTSDDARITAKNEDDIIQTIYAAIHECGHAMYDQRRPLAWRHQPIGSHLGMGVHESQSRIMEVQACHEPEFFKFLETQMREALNRPDDPALDAKNLERLVNRVEPSFIRIEADEVTYAAHVITRYRIEKAMVEGKMTIDDLPKVWNDGYNKMLGITPPTPTQGCMQDVHWPCGLVGYFPEYTIGDMMAAQFFAKACEEHPEIPTELGKGNFQPLNDWLDEHVRSKAASLTPGELVKAATGEDLNANYYLDHLSRRYLGKPFAPQGAAPPRADFNRGLSPG